jgi:protein-S-isoprenylcysteine O-methyltransferase
VLVFGPLVGSVVVEDLRFRGDSRRRARDRTYWQLQAWQLAGLFVGVWSAKALSSTALPGSGWLWAGLGGAVALGGVAIRWWAIVVLGRQFTRNLQTATDHQLVDNGPYRLLRHPSYTGAILMFAGVGIGLANWVSFAASLVLPAIGYVTRIPREEVLLRRALGEPYDDYARHTRRLVPGVW